MHLSLRAVNRYMPMRKSLSGDPDSSVTKHDDINLHVRQLSLRFTSIES